jgi:hypothetical protein
MERDRARSGMKAETTKRPPSTSVSNVRIQLEQRMKTASPDLESKALQFRRGARGATKDKRRDERRGVRSFVGVGELRLLKQQRKPKKNPPSTSASTSASTSQNPSKNSPKRKERRTNGGIEKEKHAHIRIDQHTQVRDGVGVVEARKEAVGGGSELVLAFVWGLSSLKEERGF